MHERFAEFLARLEHLRDGLFTPGDARCWPPEWPALMERLGILESAGLADEVVLSNNDHECVAVNVGFDKHPDDPERLVCVHRCLNGCGLVLLEPRDFEQWRFDLLGLAKLLASTIGTTGTVLEDVPGRVALVGTTSIAGRTGEIFLGYGLARPDAAAVVASASRLKAADYAAVLSVGVKPVDIWSVGARPMTAVLSEQARLGPKGLELELARVFPASGYVEVKPDAWITVTAAAKLLLEDVSGIDLGKAKARVSKAAGEGRFRTNGKDGRDRRIDRDSFSTWRLEQREKDSDAWERAHS